mmetsp:Transcript_24952/g.41118  ORF Transcript_24952/g.41118 Transcript_24952/m.41118 type:complete len:215 (+) Transcript_24952:655-1299(+)
MSAMSSSTYRLTTSRTRERIADVCERASKAESMSLLSNSMYSLTTLNISDCIAVIISGLRSVRSFAITSFSLRFMLSLLFPEDRGATSLRRSSQNPTKPLAGRPSSPEELKFSIWMLRNAASSFDKPEQGNRGVDALRETSPPKNCVDRRGLRICTLTLLNFPRLAMQTRDSFKDTESGRTELRRNFSSALAGIRADNARHGGTKHLRSRVILF